MLLGRDASGSPLALSPVALVAPRPPAAAALSSSERMRASDELSALRRENATLRARRNAAQRAADATRRAGDALDHVGAAAASAREEHALAAHRQRGAAAALLSSRSEATAARHELDAIARAANRDIDAAVGGAAPHLAVATRSIADGIALRDAEDARAEVGRRVRAAEAQRALLAERIAAQHAQARVVALAAARERMRRARDVEAAYEAARLRAKEGAARAAMEEAERAEERLAVIEARDVLWREEQAAERARATAAARVAVPPVAAPLAALAAASPAAEVRLDALLAVAERVRAFYAHHPLYADPSKDVDGILAEWTDASALLSALETKYGAGILDATDGIARAARHGASAPGVVHVSRSGSVSTERGAVGAEAPTETQKRAAGLRLIAEARAQKLSEASIPAPCAPALASPTTSPTTSPTAAVHVSRHGSVQISPPRAAVRPTAPTNEAPPLMMEGVAAVRSAVAAASAPASVRVTRHGSVLLQPGAALPSAASGSPRLAVHAVGRSRVVLATTADDARWSAELVASERGVEVVVSSAEAKWAVDGGAPSGRRGTYFGSTAAPAAPRPRATPPRRHFRAVALDADDVVQKEAEAAEHAVEVATFDALVSVAAKRRHLDALARGIAADAVRGARGLLLRRRCPIAPRHLHPPHPLIATLALPRRSPGTRQRRCCRGPEMAGGGARVVFPRTAARAVDVGAHRPMRRHDHPHRRRAAAAAATAVAAAGLRRFAVSPVAESSRDARGARHPSLAA